MSVVCIVEGDGDVAALPLLIRRIAQDEFGKYCDVPRPIRVHRDKFMNDPEYRNRYLALARAKAGDDGAILVLLDSDNDCPATLRNTLFPAIAVVTQPVPTRLVFAKTEFEAWFVGAIETVRGTHGIRADIAAPVDAEAIGSPKGWIKQRMSEGRTYSETVDQPALAATFDWRVAKANCPSLDKLYRDLAPLLA